MRLTVKDYILMLRKGECSHVTPKDRVNWCLDCMGNFADTLEEMRRLIEERDIIEQRLIYLKSLTPQLLQM